MSSAVEKYKLHSELLKMTTSNQSGKLLVVDSSTAMLHVLKNFTSRHGYDADHFSDPADACEGLDQRFQNFACDYRGVLLGWPEGRVNLFNDLLQKLSSSDHDALPLIVITQEMNAAVKALVKRRPKTRAFLWSEYQQASEVIDLTAIPRAKKKAGKTVVAASTQPAPTQHAAAPVVHVPGRAPAPAPAREQEQPQTSFRASDYSTSFSLMLVDNTPSICESLRGKLESSGYEVTVVSSVSEAREQIAENVFDVVVTDFFLRDESGEELCQHLQDAKVEYKPVCVVLTAKYSDNIVKRSLAVGAASCLYKNESTELLFARIDALTRTLRRQSRQMSQQQVQLQSEALLERQANKNNTGVTEPVVVNENLTASLHTATQTRLQPAIRQVKGAEQKESVELATKQVSDKPTRSIKGTGTARVVVQAQDKPEKVVVNPGIVRKAGNEAAPVKSVIAKVANGGDGQEVKKEIPTVTTPKRRTAKALPTLAVKNAVTKPAIKKTMATSTAQLQEHTCKAKRPSDRPKVNVPALDIRVPVPELLAQLENRNAAAQYSVLMLDIEIVAATGDRMMLGISEPMQSLVARSLLKLYPKQKAQACTEDGKFVLLLTTSKYQDALVLTRKVLQLIPKMVPYLSNMVLVTHACIVRIEKEEVVDQTSLLNRCREACQRTRKDGKDNAALVLPNNQYLSAVVPQVDEITVEPQATKDEAAVVNSDSAVEKLPQLA